MELSGSGRHVALLNLLFLFTAITTNDAIIALAKTTIHDGNSGTVGVGVKVGLDEGAGETEGVAPNLGDGNSDKGTETLTGSISGYLSVRFELMLTWYGVLPMPELSISVALGYLAR